LPPMRDLGGGHRSLCWLPDEELAQMQPVIKFRERGESGEILDADGTPTGEGPGFAGTPPRRPHGKRGTADLSDDADEAEEAEGSAKFSRSDGPRRPAKARSAPVGWGSQADDAKAPSAFGNTGRKPKGKPEE